MTLPWVHIIGAGVSGLSLATALTQYGSLPGEVLISDPSINNDRSQTFCFWFTESEKHLLRPEKIWDEWSFSIKASDSISKTSNALAHVHSGRKYAYGLVSGDSFRTRSLKHLQQHPQVRFSKEWVTADVIGEHVFDSRPPTRNTYRIHQSFVGFEISSEHSYPLNRVALMEEMQFGFGGLLFKYVLPLSDNRLLIEYTVFTKEHILLDTLEAFGREALKGEALSSIRIERVERAHIPMGLKKDVVLTHLGTPIGTRAGMARDSTGYGFVEMHRWSQEAAKLLHDKNRVLDYKPPRIRQWMDRCLLDIIESRPTLTPQLFMTLAQRFTGDRFASFMMNCDLGDASQMMLKSPKRSFILAAMGQSEWI